CSNSMLAGLTRLEDLTIRPQGHTEGRVGIGPDTDARGGDTARSSGRGAVIGSGGVRSVQLGTRLGSDSRLWRLLFFFMSRWSWRVPRSSWRVPRDAGHSRHEDFRSAYHRRERRPCRPALRFREPL